MPTKRKSFVPDEEEKKEEHQKLLYAYKEFTCQTLDPFFDSH